MGTSDVLGVLIGMTFVYFLLAVLASGIKEAISAFFSQRATTLEKGITQLLGGLTRKDDTAIATDFYNHPLIQSLASKAGGKPSYIPARTFALVLENVLATKQASKALAQEYAAAASYPDLVNKIPAGPLRDTLATILKGVGQDADLARKRVEQWFDDSMDRVSGWYKRWAQVILLVAAFALAVLLNADSFSLFSRLWSDAALRSQVAALAQNAAATPTASQAFADLSKLPLGWTGPWPADFWKYLLSWPFLFKLVGWGFTAFAASLGAPFWFDAMNKLVNVRLAGTPPAKQSESQSGATPAAG